MVNEQKEIDEVFDTLDFDRLRKRRGVDDYEKIKKEKINLVVVLRELSLMTRKSVQ